MASGTIRVKGLKELDRAFGRMAKDLRTELRQELTAAGRIVSDDARSRFAGTDARSAMGMRPRIRGGARVVVEQRRRKTTGQHPEFGALQMRRAFLPALASKRGEVERRLERMVDQLGNDNGF